MAERPVIVPNLNKPLINGTSMATSFNGPATIINRIPGISYDVSWTGSPVGIFSVQVSNTFALNAEGAVANAGDWATLPLTGTPPTPAGSPGNGFIDVVGTEAYAVRLVYTATSGTGNATVLAAAKVF